MYHIDWLDFLLLSKGAHELWGRTKFPFKDSLRKRLIYKPLDMALKKNLIKISRIQNLAWIMFQIFMF